MKNMKDVINRLMGEFTVESMMGCDIEISNLPEYSDDQNIAAFQKQYSLWCLQSKRFLLTDVVEPLSPAGMVSSYLKASVSKYLAIKDNADNLAMKCLYAETDIQTITQQIGMLTRLSIYKDVDSVKDASAEKRRMAIDPEQVSIPMAVYVLFTVLANDNFEVSSFNELFIRSWFLYYGNWHAKEFLLQMCGSSWKDGFENALVV